MSVFFILPKSIFPSEFVFHLYLGTSLIFFFFILFFLFHVVVTSSKHFSVISP
jgi:hypothetical protein